jgi:hypothetical protein
MMMDSGQCVDDSGPFEAPYLAFLETIATLRLSLHRYCARVTGSVMDGEDVVKEAFFRGLSEVGQVQREPSYEAVAQQGGEIWRKRAILRPVPNQA